MRVIHTMLHLEADGRECIAALQRECAQWSYLARGSEPEHARSPSRRERTEPVQHHVERRCALRDRGHRRKGLGYSRVVDGAEEVHGQMQRLGASPANVGDVLAERTLEPLRRCKPRISERDGKKATHRYGLGVAFGVAGAGLGVSSARVHGEPPALVSVTSISFLVQSVAIWLNSNSANQLGRSITSYGFPA